MPCNVSFARALSRPRSSSSIANRSTPWPRTPASRWHLPGTAALLLIEVDGLSEQSRAEAERVAAACREAGAEGVAPRQERRGNANTCGGFRRDLAGAQDHHAAEVQSRCRRAEGARAGSVRPRRAHRARLGLRIPCFGHVGDGNIHVNIMVAPDDADEIARAHVGGRRTLSRCGRRMGGIDQR